MTKEEAIQFLDNMKHEEAGRAIGKDRFYAELMGYHVEALNMAIKALEQEPVIDKIKAEIDGLTYYWCEVNPRSVIDDVLDIIDKYRKEKEE